MKAPALRRSFALLYFGIFIVSFVDFQGLVPPVLKSVFGGSQFIPSLLSFIFRPAPLAAFFVIILAVTFLYGRLYCSALCPLGILQDILLRIRRSLKKRFWYKEQTNFRRSRYAVLLIVTVCSLFAGMTFLNFTDPYSIAGKIASSFFTPVVVALNNSLFRLFSSIHWYVLQPMEYKYHPYQSYAVSSFFAGLVVFFILFKGRLYCNLLCPVGALLGLIGKFARVKLAIDLQECKSCGVCERVCKAGCINTKTKEIDYERCVVCYNCIEGCPTGLITVTSHSNGANPSLGTSRRNFLGAGMLLTAVPLAGMVKKNPDTAVVTEFRTIPVSPPGSESISHFTSACTACQLCVSSCPSQVLQPAFMEYGIAGISQPSFDFRYGFCNYECTACTQVCPTGAITKLSIADKKRVQTGIAQFVKSICIVETKGTECGACSEHCPTKAVHMVPYKNLRLPEVNDKICIGCGACEFACPTKPYKAIFVQGNRVHKQADMPAKENEKKKEEVPVEFPF